MQLGLSALVLGSWLSAMSWRLRWMPWLTLLVLVGGDVQGLLNGTELSCLPWGSAFGRGQQELYHQELQVLSVVLIPLRPVKPSDEGQESPQHSSLGSMRGTGHCSYWLSTSPEQGP